MKKISIIAIVLGFFFLYFSQIAQAKGLSKFDLSLGEYKLGMSYDDATAIRHFFRLEHYRSHLTQKIITIGYIDSFYIEDIEYRFRIEFVDEKVVKILCRFSPAHIESVMDSLIDELGQGQDKTKIISNISGGEKLIYNTQWNFPNAKINLIGFDMNTDFATVSLVYSNLREKTEREAVSTEKNQSIN